ncbi:unnamed protein product [Ranitomeya imitator]|uniref:Protein Wnt n=1 Tax=Ranitomeya imitator TaxID=111125 RepID=A0ABN9MCN1_9NEOB|nr:unnamed protein product [Ranitomeya imitator]
MALGGLTVNGSSVAWNESEHCKLLEGLVPDQTQLCKRNLELMQSVVNAAKQTKLICQLTFSDMRWNCSSIELSPNFTPDLLKVTPLPEPVPQGSYPHAPVDPLLLKFLDQAFGGGGGCGDNLRYGLQMGSAFVDAPMKSSKFGTQATKLMNLHNNAVGRQVLMDSMETKCKCHGVSGSCSVKTCWKGLQDLPHIADELKSKYLAATKVIHRQMGTRKHLVHKELDIRPVRESELLYLNSSPDYCARNPKLGSYGTQDRLCNKTSLGSDSCNLMCCGRGYNVYTETLVERCQCKYYWCCYVMCKKCERTVERYVCK